MTKLPINLLLYVAILALAGGSGYQFYLAVTDKPAADQKTANKAFEEARNRGEVSAGVTPTGPVYDDGPFWHHFRDANFVGKEPPPPPDQADAEKDPEPIPVSQTPLDEIFALICTVYDGSKSRVVIRYKNAANVEPPEELVQALTSMRDVVGAAPGSRRGGPPAVPSFGGDSGYVHEMVLEDTLWKPHEHIRLVRVAEDASQAFFVREDRTKPQEEWKEENIYPEVLDLSQEVLDALNKGGFDVRPNRQASKPAGPVVKNDWLDSQETTEVQPNRYNIGRRDHEMFRADPGRVFNQDIGTASYTSSTGRTRGVKITSIAPGYERYGVQRGDIILAINGEKVRSKADAIKVGKRQHKRGVRTFQVEFLSRGRNVTRTYVAPEK